MEPERYARMLSLFKILADDTRLRILGMVGEKPCTVEELATRLGLKEPTVSHHLQRLREAQLVTMQPDKNSRLYSLAPQTLSRLSRELLQLESVAAPEDDTPERSWERKVLETFLVDGRLVRIPASRKKREVILRWLANQFQPQQRYPEKEVNALLGRFHQDVATLRRELIGYGWLAREHQIYWKPEIEA